MSVLIPDGEHWQTVKVLRCLEQAPTISTHILSNKRQPLSRYSRYCTSFHHNTSQNDNDWINEINKLVQKLRINVILPVTLRGVELISKNRKDISELAAIPPLAEPETIALANDKWAFHKFISQRGLPSLPTVYIGKSGENIQALDVNSIGFPALLKPTSEAGGYGIVKVEKTSDLERAWHDKRIMKNHDYILQSYIPGIDICLQVFCKAGKISAYTLQKSLSDSNDYFGPQRIMEFVTDNSIKTLGESIISAMHWDGIACIDFRIDARDQKPKILEINPRFGQAILGSFVAGVNFPLIACCSALDVEYPAKYKNVRYAHPVPSAKILISRIFGRNTPSAHTKWSESGLRFTCSDPLPEIVDLVSRAGHHLKRRITRKRPPGDNNNQ